MAAYIAAAFYATRGLAGLLLDLAFSWAGLMPAHPTDIRVQVTCFGLNHSFWLNLILGAVAIGLLVLNRAHPMATHDGASHADHHHRNSAWRRLACRSGDPAASA